MESSNGNSISIKLCNIYSLFGSVKKFRCLADVNASNMTWCVLVSGCLSYSSMCKLTDVNKILNCIWLCCFQIPTSLIYKHKRDRTWHHGNSLRFNQTKDYAALERDGNFMQRFLVILPAEINGLPDNA